MSALAERAIAISKPAASGRSSVWVPMWGASWVTVNVALFAAGTLVRFPMSCAFLAGIVNGTLLSVIVVAIASERLQGGATGLLGGISLSSFRHDGSMIWKAMQNVHGFIDDAMHNLGIPGNERFHQDVEQELLYMIWTAIIVMMASLVAEWVMAARLKPANLRA